MNNCHHFIFAGVFVAMAAFAFADTFEATTSAHLPNVKTDLVEVTEKCLRWLAPGAEQTWEEIIQSSRRLSLDPRMEGVDETQAEGQLEAFGMRYMPNAYAQYQEVRAKALELVQTVKESFPKGKDSDPTGGTMFAKANKKLAESVAMTFRRRDELCFFLLFHYAGIFSEEELAEYDSRPISIRLEEESSKWPDDTPSADLSLTAADATFVAKYLPETHIGYQRLCGLFDEGAKQYAELRQMALALDAPRARLELSMLKARLEDIHKVLQNYKKDISAQRLSHAFEDTTAENLAVRDQANARKIQASEQQLGVKVYVEQAAVRMSGKIALPNGEAMDMVWCRPGRFMMGSRYNEKGRNDNETLHEVTLTKGFWMARTEVTEKQWVSVMGCSSWLVRDVGEGSDLPMRASWIAARVFCDKIGLRLPTEAEWEYACRAGSTGRFAGTGTLDKMGWYYNNCGNPWGDGRHPVGQKRPNAWGLYDMHGNVWEWCEDLLNLNFYDYSTNAVTDPKVSTKVFSQNFDSLAQKNPEEVLRYNDVPFRIRGGDYRSDEEECRSAKRADAFAGSSGGTSHQALGFRPVVHQN